MSAVQQRTIATLMGSQMLGGVALTAGIAVMALLAEDVSGSTSLAGLAGSAQVLGGALIAIPMARAMAARGRRPGLVLGYGLAVLGTVGIIVAGIIRSFPLLLVAAAVFGGASTSNSQARYAAADLAAPAHRGRDLGLVVWATTIGSAVGPNLVGPGGALATAVGVPPLVGTFLLSFVALGLGIALIQWRLRPDPLLLARSMEEEAGALAMPPQAAGPAGRSRPEGSVGLGAAPVVSGADKGGIIAGLRSIAAHPGAPLGLLTLTLGHAVMVSVMVVTPLHMSHGGATLTVIGFVISLHIIGMYAFSPITGLAVDRLGAKAVALLGSCVLMVATLLTSMAPRGESTIVVAGLFLLGLGWSCTLVSGSTLLVAAIPVRERPSSQGASDLVMGLVAAAGGASAAYIIAVASFHVLSLAAMGLAAAIGVAALASRARVAGPS